MLLNATRIRILSSHDLRAEQRNMPCRAVQLMELNSHYDRIFIERMGH